MSCPLEIFSGIPYVLEVIFLLSSLTYQDILNCRLVNQKWKSFIDAILDSAKLTPRLKDEMRHHNLFLKKAKPKVMRFQFPIESVSLAANSKWLFVEPATKDVYHCYEMSSKKNKCIYIWKPECHR